MERRKLGKIWATKWEGFEKAKIREIRLKKKMESKKNFY